MGAWEQGQEVRLGKVTSSFGTCGVGGDSDIPMVMPVRFWILAAGSGSGMSI
jgi:hypothetical protein